MPDNDPRLAETLGRINADRWKVVDRDMVIGVHRQRDLRLDLTLTR